MSHDLQYLDPWRRFVDAKDALLPLLLLVPLPVLAPGVLLLPGGDDAADTAVGELLLVSTTSSPTSPL